MIHYQVEFQNETNRAHSKIQNRLLYYSDILFASVQKEISWKWLTFKFVWQHLHIRSMNTCSNQKIHIAHLYSCIISNSPTSLVGQTKNSIRCQ